MKIYIDRILRNRNESFAVRLDQYLCGNTCVESLIFAKNPSGHHLVLKFGTSALGGSCSRQVGSPEIVQKEAVACL